MTRVTELFAVAALLLVGAVAIPAAAQASESREADLSKPIATQASGASSIAEPLDIISEAETYPQEEGDTAGFERMLQEMCEGDHKAFDTYAFDAPLKPFQPEPEPRLAGAATPAGRA